MAEDIIALIDRQLEQLRRARALLSIPDEEELFLSEEAEATTPRKQARQRQPRDTIPQKELAAAPLQAGKRVQRRARSRKPAAEASALRAVLPAAPVAVSAAEVQKAEQARFSVGITTIPAPVREGTLDALIEQLQAKSPAGKSTATSFPFSLDQN